MRLQGDVRFVLDKYALFDFFSASSLKQQTADRHVAPLGHFISTLYLVPWISDMKMNVISLIRCKGQVITF
jgi:hypothetical protein